MSVFAKITTYGIETPIKRLQNSMYLKLSDLWSGTIDIYGRLYRNQSDNGNILEAYVSTNEYKRIFLNDKIACSVGFNILSTRDISNQVRDADVDIIFTGNIYTLHNNTNRDLEKLYLQAQRSIDDSGITLVSGIKETVENVFSGFYIDDFKYLDMQPFFCFAFSCNITYTDDLC